MNDSQNAHSNAGSHFSGGPPPKPDVNKNFMATTSQGDFERDDDELEYDQEEYSSETGESDEDIGSFYQPTLITKSQPKSSKKKKKKSKSKSPTKLPQSIGSGMEFGDSSKKDMPEQPKG